MRHSIKTLVLTGALVASLLPLGCHENEQSLFIEHAKAFPDPPECEAVSVSDDRISSAMVDLSVADDANGFLLVTNALVTREEYDNNVAESNGVFIDGVQTRFEIPGQGSVGSSESYLLERYIAPETSDVVPAMLVSPSVVDELRASLGCGYLYDGDYYGELIDQVKAIFEAHPVTGNPDAAVQALVANIGTEYYDSGYAYIKFVGHTAGGIEIETPEYTLGVDLCCNCSVDWNPCVNKAETAFCIDGITGQCQNGVGWKDKRSCAEFIALGVSSWMTWIEEPPIDPLDPPTWSQEQTGCP